MPLIFPRSRPAGNGTSVEEGKEDVGEFNSIFSKVESLGGEEDQTVSISRSGALICHRSSVTTLLVCHGFTQKEKEGYSCWKLGHKY